jgi:hypothetical protein
MTTTAAGPDRIAEAARWLATGGADRSKALLPQLMSRFGLTPKQAIDAERESLLIKARAL